MRSFGGYYEQIVTMVATATEPCVNILGAQHGPRLLATQLLRLFFVFTAKSRKK